MARFNVATLEGDAKRILNLVSDKMDEIQLLVDSEMELYQQKLRELQEIKLRITPLREELSPLGELKAAVVNRGSRAKYFPQFATRNFDDSKDKEFLEFVASELKNAY